MSGATGTGGSYWHGIPSAYINDTLVANKTTPPLTTAPTNTLPLHIGADSMGANFTGIIDEPRVSNGALSANEIQAIYRAGATTRCQ